jgi:catalase (peroxidase I)
MHSITTAQGIASLASNPQFNAFFSECDLYSRQAIRAVFHDATSRSLSLGYMGAVDGSLRFETATGPNRLLRDIVEAVLPFKTDNVSFADALVLASLKALKACRGPSIPFSFGRIDALQAGPPNLLFEDSGLKMEERIADMGMTYPELVTLVAGGHSVATTQGEVAFDGTPDEFDNVFVQEMLAPPSAGDLNRVRIIADRFMAEDPDAKPIWTNFARKQQAMFASFTIAYERLCNLGWDNLTKIELE